MRSFNQRKTKMFRGKVASGQHLIIEQVLTCFSLKQAHAKVKRILSLLRPAAGNARARANPSVCAKRNSTRRAAAARQHIG